MLALLYKTPWASEFQNLTILGNINCILYSPYYCIDTENGLYDSTNTNRTKKIVNLLNSELHTDNIN